MEFGTLINVETLVPLLLSHQLLTNDEAYVCLLELTPPTQRAQKLLQYLRSKGKGVLRMLLCCLKKETTHLGHKDVADKLIQSIRCHGIDSDLICPICSPLFDVLDETFSVICANCPTENWKGLARALNFKIQQIKQIEELAEGKQRIKMILQQWREENPKTSKDSLIAKLHDVNLNFEL